MKVNKAELQKALEKTRAGLAQKELIEQATSFVFLDGRVVTYNDEISISCPVKGLEGVTGAVKAQALYEFLNKIKKDEIDLEWEDNQVIIKAGRSKAGLLFEQEIKLPFNEEIKEVKKWNALPEGVIDAIKLCHPCCSRDMSRPVLTCVHINGNVVEASDSYQIIRHQLKKKLSGKSFLIPATSAKELVRYNIEKIALEDSWAHFKVGGEDEGVIFSARIIEGEFPDINRFFEKDDSSTEFEFPDMMREALEKASIFAKKSSVAGDIPIVTIGAKDGLLELSAKNEYGWFKESMKIKHKGINFKFDIGVDFMITLFDRLKTCSIGVGRIGFTGENWNHVVSIMAGEEE